MKALIAARNELRSKTLEVKNEAAEGHSVFHPDVEISNPGPRAAVGAKILVKPFSCDIQIKKESASTFPEDEIIDFDETASPTSDCNAHIIYIPRLPAGRTLIVHYVARSDKYIPTTSPIKLLKMVVQDISYKDPLSKALPPASPTVNAKANVLPNASPNTATGSLIASGDGGSKLYIFGDGDLGLNQMMPPGAAFSFAYNLSGGVSLNELEFPPDLGCCGSTADFFSLSFMSTNTLSFAVSGTGNLSSLRFLPDAGSTRFLPGAISNDLFAVDSVVLLESTLSSVTLSDYPAGGSFVLDDVTIAPATTERSWLDDVADYWTYLGERLRVLPASREAKHETASAHIITGANSVALDFGSGANASIGGISVASANPSVLGWDPYLKFAGNFDVGYHKTQFFESNHKVFIGQWDSRAEFWVPPIRNNFSWEPDLRSNGIAASKADAWENAWLDRTQIAVSFKGSVLTAWGGWYFLNGTLTRGDNGLTRNWGEVPSAGIELSGATRLRFSARGLSGGERVEMMITPVGDTDMFMFTGQTGDRITITLTKPIGFDSVNHSSAFGYDAAGAFIVMTDGMQEGWKAGYDGPQGAYWGVSGTSNTALARVLWAADHSLKRFTFAADFNRDGIINIVDLGSRTAYSRSWFHPWERLWFETQDTRTISSGRYPVLLLRRSHLVATTNRQSTNAGNRDPLDIEVLDDGGAALQVRSTLGEVNGDGKMDCTDLAIVKAPSGKPCLVETKVLDSGGAKLSVTTRIR